MQANELSDQAVLWKIANLLTDYYNAGTLSKTDVIVMIDFELKKHYEMEQMKND